MAKKRIADVIRDRFISHTVDLNRVKEHTREQVLVNLMTLDEDLQRQILQANISGTMRTDVQVGRMENLITQTKATIATAYGEAAAMLTNQLLEIADMEAQAVPAMMNTIFRTELMSTSFTRNDLIVLARDTLIEGAPTKDWWAKQTLDARTRFATQIRIGVLQGETNEQLVNRVLGRDQGARVITVQPPRKAVILGGEEQGPVLTINAAKKDVVINGATLDNGKVVIDAENNIVTVNGVKVKADKITVDGEKLTRESLPAEKTIVPDFEGGVLDVSKREATALVRSSVQTVSNEVMQETFTQNEDVLDGWQALATLDLKTTPVCRARDGAAWDFKGNPLPQSPVQIPSPGRPPWHWQCRTIGIPVVKSWDDLAGMTGIAEIPASTRSSMDGQISEKITYEEWLRGQSKERQLQVLGQAKWELWNDGKLTQAEMVDAQGNPLTVEQLKTKIKNEQ
jgi:hypothetical protein